MGELLPEDINQSLIGRTVTMHSPFFPQLPHEVSGVVTYIQNGKNAHKIVVQEDNKGYMELHDTKLYEFKEVED